MCCEKKEKKKKKKKIKEGKKRETAVKLFKKWFCSISNLTNTFY